MTADQESRLAALESKAAELEALVTLAHDFVITTYHRTDGS